MQRRTRQRKRVPDSPKTLLEAVECDNLGADGQGEKGRQTAPLASREDPTPPNKRSKLNIKKNVAQVEEPKQDHTTKKKNRRKKKATKVADDYDLDSCVDSNIFKMIAEILEGAQHINSKTQIQKYVTKLGNIYYKSIRTSDYTTLHKHQKLFSTCIWRLMIIAFKAEKNTFLDNMFKVFVLAVTNIGLENDVQKYNIPDDTELRPLFHHILNFVFMFHNDERPIVRVRIMNLVKEILEKLNGHSTFLQPLRDHILEMLKMRIWDKISAVRVATMYCFPYFEDDVSVRQCVTFSLSFDPNNEVRKAALVVLPNFSSIKTSLYFSKAFDASEIVRAEAFLQISKLSLSRVAKKSERYELIRWGLNQSSYKVREIVEKVVLPEWLKQCGNSLVKLFSKLGMGVEFKTALLMIDALYPEGSTKEFESIDRTFIPEGQRIIPIPDLTVEKVHVWVLLCAKFKNNPFCVNQFLPETFVIVEYIKGFIDSLHEEHSQAVLEKREDDFAKYICFAFILKLCKSLEFEEGVRSEMVSLLTRILLDTLIDEPIIINATIDLAARLIETEKLDALMMTIVKDIFECDTLLNGNLADNSTDEEISRLEISEELNEGQRIRTLETQIQRMVMEPEASPQVVELIKNDSKRLGPPETVEETPQAVNYISATITNVPQAVAVCPSHLADMNSSMNDSASTKAFPQYQSTPIRINRTTVADKLSHFCTVKAETILERHHLVSALDKASSTSDYLECHTIKQQVDACAQKEKELQVLIDELRQMSPSKYIDELFENDKDNDLERSVVRGGNISMCSGHMSPPAVATDHISENLSPSQQSDGVQTNLYSGHSTLKALMIISRFLTYTQKMTPFLIALYENYITQCLEDDDARVRAYTIQLHCVYGMRDRSEGRRSMLLSLQALRYDMHDAQVAGFKSMVDLLLYYPLQFFRPKLAEDDYLTNDIQTLALPPPFHDHKASGTQMEEGVISLLRKFGRDDPTDTQLTVRITGFIKLFIRGRIRCASILAEFLSMWINPEFALSTACFHIGHFIPLYCMMSASNSARVLDAFVICVREIAACQETKEECVALASADIMKLAEFVTMNTSEAALTLFQDGYVVHERQILCILQQIKDNVCDKTNIHFARCLKYFCLSQMKTASEVKKIISEIIDGLEGAENLNGALQVKAHLRRFLKQLEKRFDLKFLPTEDEDSIDEDDLEILNDMVRQPTQILNVEDGDLQNDVDEEVSLPEENDYASSMELENVEGKLTAMPE